MNARQSLRRIWLLALAIFRGNSFANLTGDAQTKKKRWSGLGSVVLFFFLAGYFAFMTGGSAFALYDLLAPLQLQNLLPGLYVSSSVLVVFIFGTLYVLSVFYYASDVDKLLPLPFYPEEVIGAKFLVVAAYEYLFVAGVMLPPLVVYGVKSQAAWPFYLLLMGVFLLLPLIPLALATLLTMLIMRFTPLTKNKDRFKAIAGVLLLFVAIGFSYASSSLSTRTGADLAAFFSSRVEQTARLTAAVFPGTTFAVGALTTRGIPAAFGHLALLALLSIVALVIMLAAGRLLYFKGVIGLSTAASRRKALSSVEFDRQLGVGVRPQPIAAFAVYMQKDLRILVRTPIFLMNNVIMNFLFPLFLAVPILGAGSQDEDIRQLQMLVQGLVDGTDPQAAPLFLAILFGLVVFVNGTNGIAESALSREGSQFYIMKIIPMSYNRQIAAKLAVAMTLGLAGTGISLVLLVVFLRLP
ncbi:MAG: hypothetical protein EOM70_09655, partial [Clostridia bacterium]|nr:hypothetical protein [Clostridia bacterium]